MNLIRAFSYNEQVRRQSVEHVCSFTHNISSHFKSDVFADAQVPWGKSPLAILEHVQRIT